MTAHLVRAQDLKQAAVHLQQGVLHGVRARLLCEFGVFLGDEVRGAGAQTIHVLCDERERRAWCDLLAHRGVREEGERDVAGVWLGPSCPEWKLVSATRNLTRRLR